MSRDLLSHRKGIPTQCQPDRIEVLRKKRPLPDEKQLPRRCIHCGCVRDEHALRLRSIELADVDASKVGNTWHIVEKVTAIGKSLLQCLDWKVNR